MKYFHIEIFSEPLKDNFGDVGSRGKMTGSDKIFLNTLYNCQTINTKTMMEFEMEENRRRINSEIKQMRTLTNLRVRQIVSKIEDVRNPPFGYFCGYQNSFSSENSVITYDKLLYSSQFGLQGNSPGLDINTGKFVSGFSGTWRVDFAFKTKTDSNESIFLYLYQNGEQIPEAWFYSHRSSSNSGYDGNTGGRSVQLFLDLGDELHLATTTMKDSAIIFCVSLEQVNV